ncbi:MAG: Acetophenone carboxylase gamma subunit, partial [Planctomycetota bacterium]
TVVEIEERIGMDGTVLRAPDEQRVAEQLQVVRDRGIESLAICFVHGYRFPMHEQQVAAIARQLGFSEVRESHQAAPLARIVPRGETTVVDAYLQPVLTNYLERLSLSLTRSGNESENSDQRGRNREIGSASNGAANPPRLQLLTSAGGLVPKERFTGKDSVLSGPAGGVVGFSRVARAAGFDRAIGFDMGGTSTDVSRFDGRFELEYETVKAGVRIVAPMMAIETVASGGGSICGFDGVRMFVGPQSAGAEPGPACYGRGGPLAITDINFFLGRILPDCFPFPLQREPVVDQLRAIAQRLETASGRRWSDVELAEGFLAIANTQMAQAIRSISVARGYDPRQYVLVPFGGAAGQHACEVAAELEMTEVLSHPDAGLLSAYGIGLADIVRHRVRALYRALSDVGAAELDGLFEEMADEAISEVISEGGVESALSVTRSLELRYRGLDAALHIELGDATHPAEAYAAAYQQRFGYSYPGREIELVAARVEVCGRSRVSLPESTRIHATEAIPDRNARAYFDGQWIQAPVYSRDRLMPGAIIHGPAIVVESFATTVVSRGWTAEMRSAGELQLRQVLLPETAAPTQNGPNLAKSRDDQARSTSCDTIAHGESSKQESSPHDPLQHDASFDPVKLEVISRHLTAIAEQMGIALRNTATSVNVKERLDFSCAIFTSRGELVVNAPHIPVHLGAMGETVQNLIADNPVLCPGDVLVTNDPYRGGSHLPDVTVVTPVHDPHTGALRFFTASRAHHAEIGGIAPGSMPPFSKNLAEEGVRISNFKLVDAGTPRWDVLRDLLSGGPWPSRSPEDNLVDLEAQVAANHQGRLAVERLVERYTWAEVDRYMSFLQRVAEQKTRAALRRLPQGTFAFQDFMDDGARIAVAITVEDGAVAIDFSGTSGVLEGNLNANRAIVTAAVMYCLRCLVNEDIPLNQGLLAPVKMILPPSMLAPQSGATPESTPAVVGGNVETSQRVVDVLLGALGLAAASLGTMNNFLFGDATFGYYETICGGAGATPQGPGADAVHTHMTNTRLTDPEILEMRFPVRVREFSIRRGSGGAGRHRGGDGIVRRLEFLRTLEVSILSQRRGPYPPFGLQGGLPGKLGCNTLVHADGSRERLGGRVQIKVEPGDELQIETPGGGGFGAG